MKVNHLKNCKQIILSVCLNFTILQMTAQTDGLKVLKIIDHGNYSYIPQEVRDDSVYAVMFHGPMAASPRGDSVCMELYWISPCNDGYYNLFISPEQIWFTSMHDNPNPNFLFWVMDIDSMVYHKLLNTLQKAPKGFARQNQKSDFLCYYDSSFQTGVQIPEDWNDSIRRDFEVQCLKEQASQLERYRMLLAPCFEPGFQWPEPFARSKLMAYREQDLLYYLPVKNE